MTIFSKRMAYRLGGGAVTILLGVLAAAGAQRQGVEVADVPPELTAPQWADMAPMPITSGQPSSNSNLSVAQAGYSVDPMTNTEPSVTPNPSDAGPSYTGGPSYEGGPSYGGFAMPSTGAEVQPVVYDEQPANDLRAASPLPVNDQGPAQAYADGPNSMSMPTMVGPSGDALQSVNQAPISPASATPNPDVSGPADIASSSIQLPPMQMDAPMAIEMQEMPELQMEAGPSVDFSAQSQYPSSVNNNPLPAIPTPPGMPSSRELPPLPKPQTLPQKSSFADNAAPSAYGYAPSANVPAQNASFSQPRQTGLSTNARIDDGIGQAEPGDRRLEGMQSPSIVIQKRGPTEVKIGQPASFVVHVQNVGSVEAINVQVLDRIPAGMELIDASPQPTINGDQLAWSLGSLPPGDERSITMQLVAQQEGELGSVARVTFEAAASVRTRSTRPELKIVQQVRPDVLIGQQLEIDLQVSNIGTGEATGVVLQVDVPEGLDHPRGRQLDNALGSLRPGETRREILRLRAVKAGVVENTVRLISDDAESVTHTASIEVTSPQLNVQLTGPNRRYLERQATYSVNLENRGTASANNVELVAYLDRGFTFVSTENEGTYDPNRHAVLWSLPNLPAGAAGSVPLTLLPVQQGEHAIRLEAAADLNMRAESASNVLVESKAELTFSVADTADPIELGGETAYEIRVQNHGSRDDTNIQVQAKLPAGMELIRTDADAESDGRGGIVFKPHPQLAAGDELVYRVAVRGSQPDTHLITVIVNSDQSRVPVTKQESTEVYADQ